MVHQAEPGEALLRLFEETDDARLLVSEDGVIVLVNRRCEELYGWPRRDLIGKPASVLAPERLRDDYLRLREVLVGSASGESMRINLRGLRSNGEEFPVRLTVRLIETGPDARLLSFVIRPRVDDADETGFRELLEAAPDGNVIVDAQGRIVMANARVEEMFGYAEEELAFQHVEILVPEGMKDVHTELRGGFTGLARRHPMGRGTRVAARRKDGSTFPVRVLLSTLGTGDDVLVSAAIRDISELEDLREESDRVKDRFLATVSHELRTPLTAILGSAELLVEDLDDVDDAALRERLARYAAMIVRGARRELALVEDLLALTVVESGGLSSQGRTSDLRTVATTAAEQWSDRAESARVVITTDLGATTSPVRADTTWVRRAVDCLVSNAVKFTPAGGSVLVRTGGGDDAAWLEVRDTGPGIAASEEERVFDRLYRGPDAIRDEKPGAGLGLAIARSIVTSFGGTVGVVPQESGACLRMTLPRADQSVSKG